MSAVETISENVGKITSEAFDDVMSILKKVIGGKVVNSDKYVM